MTETTTVPEKRTRIDPDRDLDRAALAAAVAEDTTLSPTEKETILWFAKPDPVVQVFTEERGLMHRFLLHPAFEITNLRVETDDGSVTHVGPTDVNGGSITGVWGSIPVGALAVQTSVRTTSAHVDIVSEAVLRGD